MTDTIDPPPPRRQPNLPRRRVLAGAACAPLASWPRWGMAQTPTSRPLAPITAEWGYVADRVMGGVSQGAMARESVAGRPALRLTGMVSLDNDGGFIQMAVDLGPPGGVLDATGWDGIEIDAFGNGERYGVHLRSAAATRPWQSWRQGFEAGPAWRTTRLPFADFAPHRIDAALDLARLRRLGVVAIGRVFRVDVAVADVRLYRG